MRRGSSDADFHMVDEYDLQFAYDIGSKFIHA
jgi:hypothetical protein